MSPRDRRERAEALEREAEETDDLDTWAVASDAWEEVGDPARAWYAFVRSRDYRYLGRIIERAHAADMEDALSVPEGLNVDRANAMRSQLEVFNFVSTQPERVFAYYDGEGYVTTFMGDRIGKITERLGVVRPYGRSGGRIQYVRVQAINGFNYHGTCAMDDGTYCKLRRGKPWLRR